MKGFVLNNCVSQLSSLQKELERLHEENRKLRSTLDQITKKYSELQNQLVMTIQTQGQGGRREQVKHVAALSYQLWLSR